VRVCARAFLHVYTCVYVYVSVYVNVRARVCVCVFVCLCAFACACALRVQLIEIATHCKHSANALKHTVTHCNTLSHCNIGTDTGRGHI